MLENACQARARFFDRLKITTDGLFTRKVRLRVTFANFDGNARV